MRAISNDDEFEEEPFDFRVVGPNRFGGKVPRRFRRARRRLIVLVLVLSLAGAVLAVNHRGPFAADSGQRPLALVGALPYWNIGADAGKVLANPHFSTVSPWMYGIDDRAGIVSLVPPAGAQPVDNALAQLHQSKLAVVPTISNTRSGNWDYATIIRTLRDPVSRARHIADIVNLARQKDYPGIDIDYEDFKSADRDVFTGFISELAAALHKADKTLSVDVFAKTSDQGYDERNVAQDYRALGRVADFIRIMAYDWHWSSSEAGPIAPIDWVRSVLNYALTEIPAAKIVLGIPAYGYDWVGDKGRMVSWLQAYGLAQKYGAVVQWDATSESPCLAYRSADGKQHVVWFENAYSSLDKLALARSMHIGGAYLWLAGDEDDLMWQRLSPKDIENAAKALVNDKHGPGS